jgi:hypothetical protein
VSLLSDCRILRQVAALSTQLKAAKDEAGGLAAQLEQTSHSERMLRAEVMIRAAMDALLFIRYCLFSVFLRGLGRLRFRCRT